MAENTTSLMKISDLSVQYNMGGSIVRALDELSLEIPTQGYTLGVVGESGSGKTTLGMSILNAIERPGRIVKGNILYNGRDVLKMSKEELRKYRWREVSMVYQSAMNSLNPVKSVSDPIVEVLKKHKGATGKEASEQALKLLSEVGINQNRVKDYPFELSGGMRQRVVIALALALSPRMLIADEPTSALDVVVQKQILKLLKREVLEKKLSLIFITHEISLLSGLVQNVAVMYSGEAVEIGPINDVLFDPLHPYTEMLLSTLITLESEDGSTSNYIPEGGAKTDQLLTMNSCRYANRCKYAFERCRNERPKLREAREGRYVACHKYS